MTLYLKYRPQTLEELDLEHVRNTLTKIVKSGEVPHAFLFSGPKGSGKTSAARIIAKILNCQKRKPGQEDPCGKCEQCISVSNGSNIDVIEMDAASHRGIDDMRLLRDAVKLSPAKAAKKVYIIDEAHMLTTEASNALLKTLEEPPSHVVFILATTNPEKLLETIRSRCVLINFTKGTKEEIVRSLENVVEGEKLKVDKSVLQEVAGSSDGSFRDAMKLFESLIYENNLTLEKARNFLLKQDVFDIEKFTESLVNKDAKACLEIVENAIEGGVGADQMCTRVTTRLKSALFCKLGFDGEDVAGIEKVDLIKLIKLVDLAYSESANSSIEQLPLELAVVQWCVSGAANLADPKDGKSKEHDPSGITLKTEKVSEEQKTSKSLVTPDIEVVENVSKQKEEVRIETGSDGNLDGEVSEEIWGKILAQVRPKNTSTEALLRAARPISYDGKKLMLGVYYSFHKERLEETVHKRLLEEVVEAIFGSPVRVECFLTEPPKRRVEAQDKIVNEQKEEVVLTEGTDEDVIKVAKEIFGS